MELKEAIINEFNLLVDNLQNSFIEKLKQRLLQSDLSPDPTNHEDLPQKRSEASKVPKPRKTSKLPEDNKDSKDSHSASNDQSSLKAKESKLKKIRKNSEETDQDHIQAAKKPSEKQVEAKQEKPKTEEKSEPKPESRHESKDSALNKDSKEPKEKKDSRDIKEEKDSKDPKSTKEDQKYQEIPIVPKKTEEVKKPHESKPHPQESSKTEDLKRNLDPEKVHKWTNYYERVLSTHKINDDQNLYKILINFSQDINDKLTQAEVGLIDLTLNYLKEIFPTSHKSVKPLIQSIISRCKSKLPRGNHINKHLESIGVKLN